MLHVTVALKFLYSVNDTVVLFFVQMVNYKECYEQSLEQGSNNKSKI